MTLRLAILAVAGAAALSLVAPASAAVAPPLKVKTTIDPTWPLFADTITARVSVIIDGTRVDPRSVRLDANFGALKQEGDVQMSAGSVGSGSFRSWRYRLTCFEPVCVPGRGPVAVQLPPATVKARSVSGSALTVPVVWREFSITGRVPPAAADKTPFEYDASLPPPTYRFNPTWLALGLDGFAAILALLAIGLVAFERVRRQRAQRRAIDDRPPVVRALAYVREAQARRAEDRRTAVGLLSRTLGRNSDGLDAVASQVAWSADEPSPDRLEQLARTVEADLEESQ